MFKRFNDAISSGKIIHTFLTVVLPLVNQEVDRWQNYAQTKMQGELQTQALASIGSKKFHCQGGNFYSIYPGVDTRTFILFVVALQTISDYLDNLCDRAAIIDESAFRQLHYAMTDALNPTARHHNYYAAYPFKDDGGYLDCLVTTCQSVLHRLPSYPLIKTDLLHLASLYSDLQTYKHIDMSCREQAMLRWLQNINNTHELTHWEFAAATGSTLGMFMLAAAAHQPNLTEQNVHAITVAYFPWICGLHIQLDYFIDQAEDRQNHDLNFIFYYKSDQEILDRLSLFYRQSLHHANSLPQSFFAATIVRGLLSLYLSDPKVTEPTEKTIRKELLHSAGLSAKVLYHLCKALRHSRIL